jgi:glycosyltransferase involved in cell wall biosynthesis
MQQTRLADEIIISDDGSIDNTITIIKEYQDKFANRIKLYQHPVNLGVYKNFPFAIEQCTGDIIFTCDQDDYWLPNKIEKHLERHLSNDTIDLVYSNADVVLETIDNYLYPLWEPETILDTEHGQASIASLLYKGRSIAGCCMSFKRSILLQIIPFPNQIYHDDWIATTTCILGSISGISESLIKYRQHGQNAVGIIRGSKLSFYKSLFTNVPFYYKSDQYIHKRNKMIYTAMESNDCINLKLRKYDYKANLVFYANRTSYLENSFINVLRGLFDNLVHNRYRYHHGTFTFIKDLYNLLFIKILVRNRTS